MNALHLALTDFLRLRRSMGYKLVDAGLLLPRFVDFLIARGADYITVAVALEWAQSFDTVQPNERARRLSYVRMFARYLIAHDPRTEIPPAQLLPYRVSRAKPHLYSDEEVQRLLDAALAMPSARKNSRLRPWMYHCLFGLLAVTGLRIGVSALKGLAWALEKPCCGVSTLAAMARNLAHMEGLIVCAMDARRNQVYNALFLAHDGVLTRQCPDRAIGLAELAEEIKNRPEPKFVVGDGAGLCYNYLLEQDVPCRMAPPQLVMQNAVGVALAAEEMAAAGQVTTARDLVPVYLRLSQAERERLARGLKITLD